MQFLTSRARRRGPSFQVFMANVSGLGLAYTLLFIAGAVRADPPNYGPTITQAEAEDIAQGWAKKTLRDPYSARIDIDPVRPVTCWFIRGRLYGYGFTFRVNARNAYGGYTGEEPWYMVILFKNGNQIEYDLPGPFGATMPCHYVDKSPDNEPNDQK